MFGFLPNKASFISFIINVSLPAVTSLTVVEVNSIVEVLDNRNTAMQRIALLLGFRTWDVNAKNEENDFIEAFYKELKEIESRKNRRKQTRKPRKRKK